MIELSKVDRDNKVRAVLAAAEGPLGPTEIARQIGEAWCGGGNHGYPLSSAIVPVLRRIGAVKAEGLFGKYIKAPSAADGPTPQPHQATAALNFVPSSGLAYSQPSRTSAEFFRSSYPERRWLYNPWSGELRSAAEVAADPQGLLLIPDC